MERVNITPRNNWQKEVEKLGFGFHTTDILYWDESAYYSFTLPEILNIEKATAELWDMCLEAVQYVIDQKLYSKFSIPQFIIPHIEKTWNDDWPAIYGRFDLGYNNGQIKLFEFNADTPTSLFETGIVQWFWLKDFNNKADQFNSLHEKLINYWKVLIPYLQKGILHFSCVKGSLEDLTTCEYMRDCAIQAGLETQLVYIDDLGWDNRTKRFVDMSNQPVSNIFKLYPWEWMLADDFGKNIILDSMETIWIEPSWKMILSNKAILPILWKLFKGHPYLLECYFEGEKTLSSYIRKPILSREGANIDIVKNGVTIQKTSGDYGKEGFIVQDFFELHGFNGKNPVIGSWIVGQEPAGMCIRETTTLITDNSSRFIPHLIE